MHMLEDQDADPTTIEWKEGDIREVVNGCFKGRIYRRTATRQWERVQRTADGQGWERYQR